tara:strand:- start:965 stop:1228 length:264 start_codon:yes stop_codon:yes gene_type:complete
LDTVNARLRARAAKANQPTRKQQAAVDAITACAPYGSKERREGRAVKTREQASAFISKYGSGRRSRLANRDPDLLEEALGWLGNGPW